MTELTKEQKKELALKYADQVANALRAKFLEHSVYVHYIEAVDFDFVEILVKRKKDNMDWTVAYSDAFFYEMADVEEKQKRAGKIYKDLKTHMGIHE